MTRSVEIPEAALAKATEAIKNRMLESGSFGDAAQEAIEAALPYLAPAGDGGLREALESRKATLHDWVADWPTNKEYEAWTDEIEFIERTLAAHPAAPAAVVGVCEHPSDIFGPCTLLQGHELHGYLHLNAKGEKWSNAGEPAHTAHPAAPAVPQPVEALDVEKFPCACPDSFQDNGIEATNCPRHNWPEMEPWLREAGYTLIPAAVPQPVDREALADDVDALLWQHRAVASNGTQTVCACDRTWRSDTEHRTHLRNAVLAVLAGEQEQVEK